jgi:hypothetical protein
MTYACHYDVPADPALYRQVKAAMGGEPAEGLVVHLVTRNDREGLRHLTVWKTQGDWERFRQARVERAVQQVCATVGQPVPPRPLETEMEVVDVQVGGHMRTSEEV